MKKDKPDDRDATIIALQKDVAAMQEKVTTTIQDCKDELEDYRYLCDMEIESAHRSSEELLRLIEERFGRKVREDIELDLKCRRS